MQSKYYTYIDPGMCWPTRDVSGLSWKLRYGVLNRNEQLVVASVIDAYVQMINDSQKKRNIVCRALRNTNKGG